MEIVYHPERITRPLVKIGGKGNDRFEPIPWDQAMERIAEKMLASRDRWGAESVVLGTGTMGGLMPYLSRFLTVFGSPNYIAPVNYSGGPNSMGGAATCGFPLVKPEYASTKCILLWAHNPDNAWPGLFGNELRQGLASGAKLIVVDPRGIRLAKKADHWLQIRPGTDVALALGFINIIIENELYDRAFVEQWTVGFEKLRAHVAAYTPERCAQITWLSPQDIEDAALTFARVRPATIGAGVGGTSQANDAFDLSRSLAIISAITGNLEVSGGNPRLSAPTRKRNGFGAAYNPVLNLPEHQANKALGGLSYPFYRRYPMGCPPETVWPAILNEDPYPVKVMGVFASNPMCAYANSPQVKAALGALDFLFVVDYFQTPTTAMADVVLPPAHWSERDDMEDLHMNHVFCQAKAVEPLPECRDEKQILIDLARMMDLQGYWHSIADALDYRLELAGMTFEQLREVGHISIPVAYRSYEQYKGFKTPSGKVELYADYLEKMGISPLPQFREPAESPHSQPELFETYPLILTTGARSIVYTHSSHRNIPSLRKRFPDPELQIHPDTARKLGIADGEWVYLASPRGRVEIKARYFEHIHPQVVHAFHGFWHGVKDGWQRININMITDNQSRCPVSAGVPLRASLCRVERFDG
jgi:anaerobic selenocysteine-containing dehydrogenase